MLKGEDLNRPTYTCLQTIGEGSVGICRKGRHEVFETDIVQKTISLLGVPDGIAHEPRLLEQFNHDHIIKVSEAQWDPDPRWAGLNAVTFVCPYYPGGSVMDSLLEGHVFSLDVVLALAARVLDALAYLHGQKGYLHRDIKPGNILLDERRTGGCLADLGSACIITSEGTDNHGGTPLYLDPAAEVTGRMTVRSDLYALGVTLVEMLRGRFPYEDLVNDSVMSRLSTGKRALADRWYELPPEVPPRAARFLRCLMHTDPSKRPASAEQALRTLGRLTVMPWVRLDDDGSAIKWTSRWPVTGRGATNAREYRVTVSSVGRGPRAGQSSVQVAQRIPEKPWRRMRGHCGYLPTGDDNALARVFREVERHAQR